MTRHALRRMTRALAGTAAVLATGAAAAPLPNVVAPLTVSPRGDPPKIVTSFPAAGETIAPGALVMRITFDQPMDEHGFAFAPAQNAPTPDCLKTPRLLNDEKTFVLLCTTRPNTGYVFAFNAAPQGGFENIGGVRAAPSTLSFSTNGEQGPDNLDDALKAAKLTRDDVPIAVQP